MAFKQGDPTALAPPVRIFVSMGSPYLSRTASQVFEIAVMGKHDSCLGFLIAWSTSSSVISRHASIDLRDQS